MERVGYGEETKAEKAGIATKLKPGSGGGIKNEHPRMVNTSIRSQETLRECGYGVEVFRNCAWGHDPKKK